MRERNRLGIAIAAMVRMIATTISNSISGGPREPFLRPPFEAENAWVFSPFHIRHLTCQCSSPEHFSIKASHLVFKYSAQPLKARPGSALSGVQFLSFFVHAARRNSSLRCIVLFRIPPCVVSEAPGGAAVHRAHAPLRVPLIGVRGRVAGAFRWLAQSGALRFHQCAILALSCLFPDAISHPASCSLSLLVSRNT